MALIDHHISPLKQISNDVLEAISPGLFSYCKTLHCFEQFGLSRQTNYRIKLKYNFVETARKFIIAELSIRKLGSSSVLIIMRLI